MQASGEATYTSDIGLGSNQLYAAVVVSSEALAFIDSIDTSEALEVHFTGSLAMPAWLHMSYIAQRLLFKPFQTLGGSWLLDVFGTFRGVGDALEGSLQDKVGNRRAHRM